MDTSSTSPSDEALRAELRRAADERMDSPDPLVRARAGQVCLEAIAELRRRGVALWHDGGRAATVPVGSAVVPAPRVPATRLRHLPAAG